MSRPESQSVLPTRLWMGLARLRQRAAWRRAEPREALVARYTAGRSFADVGALWGIDGAIAFGAEAAGATRVTAIDLMEPTEGYLTEHRRRASAVRYVGGDIHRAEVVEAVGRHDVVWCSGLLYHAPHPLLMLERLREITSQFLILATETLPELPGVRGGCVFLPGLGAGDRRLHASARPGVSAVGLTTPFEPSRSYEAWWWAISRSALRGMLTATGFQIVEEHGGPLHATVVARPSSPS